MTEGLVFVSVRRLSQARGQQCGSLGPTSYAAIGQLAVDGHSGDRTDSQLLSPLSDVWIVHVQDTDLAGRAGQAIDELDRFLASRTGRAEHFNGSFGTHSE